jgi:hypothetical protein
MAYVGYTGVADLANTTDGFALGVGAQNAPTETNYWGLDVGDGGVVDMYHNGISPVKSYIADETGVSTYVLQETEFKIVLESS